MSTNRTDPSRQYCRHTVQHKHYNTALCKHTLTGSICDMCVSEIEIGIILEKSKQLLLIPWSPDTHMQYACPPDIHWCWSQNLVALSACIFVTVTFYIC